MYLQQLYCYALHKVLRTVVALLYNSKWVRSNYSGAVTALLDALFSEKRGMFCSGSMHTDVHVLCASRSTALNIGGALLREVRTNSSTAAPFTSCCAQYLRCTIAKRCSSATGGSQMRVSALALLLLIVVYPCEQFVVSVRLSHGRKSKITYMSYTGTRLRRTAGASLLLSQSS